MKKFIKSTTLFFSIAFFASSLNFIEPVYANDFSAKSLQKNQYETTITLVGEGKINIKPDTSDIVFYVSDISKETTEAQNKNKIKTQNIIDALKEYGISENNIKIQEYSIYPEYDYDDNYDEILKGYRASNKIVIKTKDIDNIISIIDIGVKNGITSCQEISFYIEENNDCYNKALKLALDNANDKANFIADILEKDNIQIIDITEIPTYNSYKNEKYYSEVIYDSESSEENKIANTNISYDDIEIESTIYVTYSFGE